MAQATSQQILDVLKKLLLGEFEEIVFRFGIQLRHIPQGSQA